MLGCEHPAKSPANTAQRQPESTNSGAPAVHFDIELRLIVDHWHAIPEPVRRMLVGIVKAFIEQPDADARRQRIQGALNQTHAIGHALDGLMVGEPV